MSPTKLAAINEDDELHDEGYDPSNEMRTMIANPNFDDAADEHTPESISIHAFERMLDKKLEP
eukprot:9769761-Karenia_brevis.AAC.1